MTYHSIAWQKGFPEGIALNLGNMLKTLEKVAKQAEVLSMFPEKHSSADLQALNVHAFYLAEVPKILGKDFTLKADCLKSLRKNHQSTSSGLSVVEYERMIESRLLVIAPIIENMVKAEEKLTTNKTSGLMLERSRQLSADVHMLMEFFKSGSEPSPWIQFSNALAKHDLAQADNSLNAIAKKTPGATLGMG